MGYRFPQETMQELLRSGRILFGEDHSKLIELKIYLSDYKQKLASVIDLDGRAGANELKSIFGNEKVFNNPKPTRLLSELLSFVTRGDDIVLDFFAGSGTTAHAVAKLNAEDGGTRRFILVSSTEATADEPDRNLCRDVCAQRVRRVLGGYTNAKGEAVPGLGGGFAYLRARRLPRHRVSRRLGHVQAWTALCLMHDVPLAPWAGHGLATAKGVAYLADFEPATLDALRGWLAHVSESVPIVYSWAPERLASIAARFDARPLPQTLVDRFGR